MEVKLKIHPPHVTLAYYERLPSRVHKTGDLWRCVPTFSLISVPHTSGVVITPACDLANDKTPTITYLPIISVSEYLLSWACYSCVRPVLIELLQKAKRQDMVTHLPRATQPSGEELALIIADLETSNSPHSAKILDGLKALSAGPEEETSGRLRRLASCLGDRWLKMLERIVSNSYADDIHFLPPDGLPVDVSVVPSPSVVLFRMPLTLQRSWFDKHMDNSTPATNDPLKSATLKLPFLTDMLTRFARLYIRLGSPDLSDGTVSELVAAIDGGCTQ